MVVEEGQMVLPGYFGFYVIQVFSNWSLSREIHAVNIVTSFLLSASVS
jgi:hypothetical protein